MFEPLDDPDEFTADEAFHADTTRRVTRRVRRRTAIRVGGGALCLAAIAPVAIATRPSTRISTVGPAIKAPETSLPLRTDPDATTRHETSPASTSGAQNFLVVGADNNACLDPSSPYTDAFGDRTALGERSDTIMVVRIDPAMAQAAILSFPRDLWVKIPGQGMGRLNGAYQRDDPRGLIETIGTEFGIAVDHYIQLDFCAFKKVVDAVGGVTVPLPAAVRDTTTGLAIEVPGCHTFSGEEALAYVRSRHIQLRDEITGEWADDPSADRGRVSRQQDFVRRTLVSAARSGLFQPELVSGLYDSFKNDLVVDSKLTIAKMIELFGVLRYLAPGDLRSYQVEATDKQIAGVDVLIAITDTPSMRSILDIFRGAPPAAVDAGKLIEQPAASTPATALVPDPTVEC